MHHHTAMRGFEQRLGFVAGGSAQPRRQTLRGGQSSLLVHGRSRSRAELRSTQAAANSSATKAPQPHWPSTSFGQVLLNGSHVHVPCAQDWPCGTGRIAGAAMCGVAEQIDAGIATDLCPTRANAFKSLKDAAITTGRAGV